MAAKKKTRNSAQKPTPPDGVEPLLVDRNQAAALLGVSWLTLLNWAQAGILKPVELPTSRRRRPGDRRLRRVLYSMTELRAFAEQAKARG